MELFLKDWLNHPQWWFDPTHQSDEYLITTYGSLLELPPENTLGCLVVHDQLARHKYRNNPEKIQAHLQIALSIYRAIHPTSFSSIEWCFYALPVRHANNPVAIFKLLHQAWQRPADPTLNNFLKATYNRLPLDQTPFIEEHLPQPIVASLSEFSDIVVQCPLYQVEDNQSKLYKLFEDYILKNKITSLILSLSGGVDSQICSYILTSLQKTIPFQLVAVHINYNNRSPFESAFVKDWCNTIKLPLYIRHITEIKRAPCMERGLRTTYEDYTRNVRYHTYKAVWKKISNDPIPIVMLGHNQNDVFENILTNITHKAHYDNLKGMTSIQVIDQIAFHRPMLTIPKEEIYEYASDYGIPHLVDSTPSWSQRGKIRDIVKPALQNWDPHFIPATFHLANRLTEQSLFVEEVVDTVLSNKQADSFTLPDRPIYYTELFWESLLKKLSIRCSYKSLQNLLSFLKTKKPSQRININKTTSLIVSDRHFHITELPFSKA